MRTLQQEQSAERQRRRDRNDELIDEGRRETERSREKNKKNELDYFIYYFCSLLDSWRQKGMHTSSEWMDEWVNVIVVGEKRKDLVW